MLRVTAVLAYLGFCAFGIGYGHSDSLNAAHANKAYTICEIFQKIRNFQGKNVMLDATFVSDRREHAFLLDSRCPKKNLKLYDDKNVQRDGKYEKFDRLILPFPDAPRSARVKLRIFGRIKLNEFGEQSIYALRYIDFKG